MAKKNTSAKRIVIVEDDALLLTVISDAFAREGYEIATVVNGLKVEETVSKFSPDCILLDLIIPGIDGFAVLKALKSKPETEKIPVVILSNLGDEGDIRSGKALGADEYFIKANIEMKKIVAYVKKRIGA